MLHCDFKVRLGNVYSASGNSSSDYLTLCFSALVIEDLKWRQNEQRYHSSKLFDLKVLLVFQIRPVSPMPMQAALAVATFRRRASFS